MKSIILLLAMIGIIMIAVGYIQNNLQCPPPRIEYRYIPKTFTEEQNSQTPLLAIAGIKSMFEDDTPWIQTNSYATSDIKFKK